MTVDLVLVMIMIVVVLLTIRGLNINIKVTHEHIYMEPPIMPASETVVFEDPHYDANGDLKDKGKEEVDNSIDTLLKAVNGIMLGEEDNDAE